MKRQLLSDPRLHPLLTINITINIILRDFVVVWAMSESTDDSPRRKPIQEQIHYDKDGFQSTEYHLRLQNYLVD